VTVHRSVPHVVVDDLDDAEAFYVGLLGMRAERGDGVRRFVGAGGASVVALAETGDGILWEADFAIEVDDFDAVRARVAGCGVRSVVTQDAGGTARFLLRDPDGYLVAVCQR